jgi:hypothetical protein
LTKEEKHAQILSTMFDLAHLLTELNGAVEVLGVGQAIFPAAGDPCFRGDDEIIWNCLELLL